MAPSPAEESPSATPLRGSQAVLGGGGADGNLPEVGAKAQLLFLRRSLERGDIEGLTQSISCIDNLVASGDFHVTDGQEALAWSLSLLAGAASAVPTAPAATAVSPQVPCRKGPTYPRSLP